MFTDVIIPIEVDHGGQFNFPINIKAGNEITLNNIRLVLSSIRNGDIQKTLIDIYENTIIDQEIEQNEIDNLYEKFKNLELLDIEFYTKNIGYDIYYQGFLGRINNITIEFRDSNYYFIFGNVFTFNCECLNGVKDLCEDFNVFIKRFLPDLLENNKFTEKQKRNIEKFMFQYI